MDMFLLCQDYVALRAHKCNGDLKKIPSNLSFFTCHFTLSNQLLSLASETLAQLLVRACEILSQTCMYRFLMREYYGLESLNGLGLFRSFINLVLLDVSCSQGNQL